jgi:hypothetical protein
VRFGKFGNLGRCEMDDVGRHLHQLAGELHQPGSGFGDAPAIGVPAQRGNPKAEFADEAVQHLRPVGAKGCQCADRSGKRGDQDTSAQIRKSVRRVGNAG